MKLLILNGPNLNLLGRREPEIYGNRNFEDYLVELKQHFRDIEFGYLQSNLEGELINALQAADGKWDGIIFNPAGYSHTSVALADTIAAVSTPVVEVHISNIHAREPFRQQSLTARNSRGVIGGFGLDSYRLAVESFRIR
ncbi:MAG: type II 3-dehydroquinate dehydratase [Bacteroidia bacterium]|jgi:3-dehydroquinate dehydratase-2|nr:type II 3-dehydroquinate dehydratase [Bacteroidia bacterium]MBP6010149.1 type II 3-dehydroquinate dehydratase [Bacteroidia bacterium]MBP7269887.1 type II 3-dehydroquinate dehydratase [Bacteroidia bacterium]MBP7437116.1 type II 3-dehydroquinate dehydratase [Bacteroidia bacterium]MBP7772005.1 type II 3-dehydroquinate dehydratase [Bacteroidia bacterium]